MVDINLLSLGGVNVNVFFLHLSESVFGVSGNVAPHPLAAPNVFLKVGKIALKDKQPRSYLFHFTEIKSNKTIIIRP